MKRLFQLIFSGLPMFLCPSCSPVWSELGKDIDDIETQEAIKVIVDKEALQKDTDVEITIKVTNKDSPPIVNVNN